MGSEMCIRDSSIISPVVKIALKEFAGDMKAVTGFDAKEKSGAPIQIYQLDQLTNKEFSAVEKLGAVIVSTPQQVALADARKGIDMYQNDKVNVPILGLIENMAYFTPAELPENKYYIFGKEGCKNLAKEMNVPLLAQIPIVQSICEGGDDGAPAATKVAVSYTHLTLPTIYPV